MMSWGPKANWSLQPDSPVLGRALVLLPDQVAWERGYLWENSVMVDGGTITWTSKYLQL